MTTIKEFINVLEKKAMNAKYLSFAEEYDDVTVCYGDSEEDCEKLEFSMISDDTAFVEEEEDVILPYLISFVNKMPKLEIFEWYSRQQGDYYPEDYDCTITVPSLKEIRAPSYLFKVAKKGVVFKTGCDGCGDFVTERTDYCGDWLCETCLSDVM